MRLFTRLGIILVLLLAAAPASAALIAFEITYDGSGWTLEKRTALQAAANTWGSMLEASFGGETIQIKANWNGLAGLAGTEVLGYLPIPGTVLVSPLAISSHFNGMDLSGGNPEMEISFNANPEASGVPKDWYFGVDGAPPASQFDFVSVAIHEIAHGLGWESLIEQDGTGTELTDPATGLDGEYYGLYDPWVWSPDQVDWLINLDPSVIGTEMIGGNLFWGGPNGVAANGGARPELYSPPGFRPGSTVSHLDSVVFNGSLMEPIRLPGEAVHTVSDVEKGILQDLFWTFASSDVAPVPEPSTFAIFLGGGLVLAVALRRRNRR